ncbi:glutamate receptor 1-like [Patiria miniata]|uniref:Ionotropic glutamate receptor C-terminal domain-containing protein n=1 Tax=Patiria miniata TaxID=46514 RepID=A0A914AWI0_PATMI|nr:glutamate receptor 1-like [Patiria miniata]
MAVIWGLAALFIMSFIGSTTSQSYKIGAMYGANTNMDNHYKELFVDATTYINRDPEFMNGNRETLNVYNYRPIAGTNWSLPNAPQALRAACTFASSVDMHGLIVPSDVCPGCSGHTGRIVGNAFAPVIALDQASGSKAYKMLPTDSDLLELWVSVINHYKWQDFIFIHDGDSAYSMAWILLEMENQNKWHVVPYQIYDEADYAEMAKDLKKRRTQNYLLFLHEEERLPGFVNWMLDSGMFGDKYHWIFGNLEPPISRQFLDDKLRIHTSFLTRFKMKIVEGVESKVLTRNPIPTRNWPFRERTAYDSMLFFAKAMTVYREENGRYPEAVPKCGDDLSSQLGTVMQKVSYEGLSGEVAFNSDGDRVNYTINIFFGKDKHNIRQAGVWTQNIDHYERKYGEKWPKNTGRLHMTPFRQSDPSYIKILSIEEPPLLMLRDHDYTRARRQSSDELGLDRYYGIIPELLVYIQYIFEHDMGMEFKYKIELIAEGYYGKRNPNTGDWDGMVKELQDSDADLAAGAFTVTQAREEVIDFTKDFYKGNIKTLIKHPNWVRDFPFNFAFAHDWDTWLVNLFAFGITILVFWALMRFHPLEYRKQSEIGQATREQSTEFTLRNVAWMLTGVVFLRGHKLSPASIAGRILLAAWFFFSLVMVFTYMLNLTDFIAIDKDILTINDPVDLLNEPLLKIGMVRHGPTHDYYSMSSKASDQQLMSIMGVLDRDPFVERMRDGALRVRNDNGHYALVSEELLLTYYTQSGPWCDLYIVGDPVKKMKYAFATPSGSPLRDQITYAINKLKQNGTIKELVEKKWFGDQKCEEESLWESESVLSINANDLEGIYYVLAIGLVLSAIIFFIDVLCYWVFGSCSSAGDPRPSNPRGDGFTMTLNPRDKPRDERDYGKPPEEKSPNLWI